MGKVGPKPTDEYFVIDPNEIMMDNSLRGRCKPCDEEFIMSLAISMLKEEQQQPVICRQAKSGFQLVAGYNRTAAAQLIRKGFIDPLSKELVKDARFMLKMSLTTVSEAESFKINIVENAMRRQTSPIDDALNQDHLRTKYNMTDAQIQRLYHYQDANKVGRLHRLLSLPKKAQDFIHDGKLPVSAALDILDMEANSQKEMLQSVYSDIDNNKKVVGSNVRKMVREKVLESNQEKPQDTQKFKHLSMKEVREFFTELCEHEDTQLSDLGKSAIAWLSGKQSKNQFTQSLQQTITT